ncbi:MAG TPA: AAA family ATPase [Nocardioides sp.]|uniref:AAA family ATPase n=1 Tax=Nocardioides sp. TaxID=35761 RepID=UPI002E3739B2|nr:AAA family ATPase [Nocardioides sp.]HEX5090598.1 AAA family ATPase [Nocardioides sp.]
MPRLVLINGAPGSGKSTIAEALGRLLPNTRTIDIDLIKHALPSWDSDPNEAGLEARRLAAAEARAHLTAASDVVIGQYLARSDFINELQHVAEGTGAKFTEVILDVDAGTLRSRLTYRSSSPGRTEHAINNRLVDPTDAPQLVSSMRTIEKARPGALRVDASGTIESTLAEVVAALGSPGDH